LQRKLLFVLAAMLALPACVAARADRSSPASAPGPAPLPAVTIGAKNGEEIELESGLPLGTMVGVKYPEREIHLEPGDTLTFLSDGVVEARGTSGELFGFERTRELIQQPAQTIADRAREFGQQDDITVLTLALTDAIVAAT